MEIKRVVQDPENLTVISLPTCPPFFRSSTSASIVVHSTLSADYVYRKMRLYANVCIYVCVRMHINMSRSERKGEERNMESMDGVFVRNV